MLLSACIIAKDESASLARCLASLAGLVDEVVVYDTGSADDTVAVAVAVAAAEAAGARVVQGPQLSIDNTWGQGSAPPMRTSPTVCFADGVVDGGARPATAGPVGPSG